MKRVRPSANPRKFPIQERSRATVDAITQAATYILTRFGWERLTTNAIAERAGVNISSLYQYFPNKEAIVAELKRRHIAGTRKALATILSGLSTQSSLREVLTRLVEAMVREHRMAPAMHRVFAEELPRTVRCALSDEEECTSNCSRPFSDSWRTFQTRSLRSTSCAQPLTRSSTRPPQIDRRFWTGRTSFPRWWRY